MREQLQERRKLVIQELRAYGDSDGIVGLDDNSAQGDDDENENENGSGQRGSMREISKRYGALVKEIETVKTGIRRLEGEQ